MCFCLCFVSCFQCCLCLWIVHSWLHFLVLSVLKHGSDIIIWTFFCWPNLHCLPTDLANWRLYEKCNVMVGIPNHTFAISLWKFVLFIQLNVPLVLFGQFDVISLYCYFYLVLFLSIYIITDCVQSGFMCVFHLLCSTEETYDGCPWVDPWLFVGFVLFNI